MSIKDDLIAAKADSSTRFNELPFETRRICGLVLSQHQLRDLKIERDRAVKAHRRHLAEIDSHIANVEQALVMRYRGVLKDEAAS